jgi:uncharacterized protein (UPF0335 family)
MITGRWFLQCSKCKNVSCLECANAEKRFFNTMSPGQKTEWVCVPCKNKQPKGTNIITGTSAAYTQVHVSNSNERNRNDHENTKIPVSSRRNLPTAPSIVNKKNSKEIDSKYIITTRQQKLANHLIANKDNDSDESDVSLLGNTMCTPQNNLMRNDTSINQSTVDKISHLLDTKLEQYKTSTVSELKSEMRALIQQEIHHVISSLKLEITENMKCVTSKQTALQSEIDQFHSKIMALETEQKKLKNEIQNLHNGHKIVTEKPTEDISKRIVLYGLDASQRDNENELYVRIANVFRGILNVNIEGYIESLHRLGKRGNRRPIVIELISKRMSQYILDNCRAFQGTGLTISRYLDTEGINKRRGLIVLLQEARKQGKNAVIRNNTLVINGKAHLETSQIRTPSSVLEDQSTHKKQAGLVAEAENKYKECVNYSEQRSLQDICTSTPKTHQHLDQTTASTTRTVIDNFRT